MAAVKTVVQGMTIACPPGWRDKSMLILNADHAGASGIAANLVVTLETLPGDLPPEPFARLEAFVERQLRQMRHALPDMVERFRRNPTAASASAELIIEWVSNGAPITQWITYAPSEGNSCVIATATAGRGDFSQAESAFRDMLESFRIV